MPCPSNIFAEIGVLEPVLFQGIKQVENEEIVGDAERADRVPDAKKMNGNVFLIIYFSPFAGRSLRPVSLGICFINIFNEKWVT